MSQRYAVNLIVPELANPLVSVIMPSYNHEMFVSNAIDSVLTQTYENFELIIIDDGSKDGTWAKICQYSDQPRIKFYRRENKGLIETLKELRMMATGKYLTILASDDMFHRNKLEVMVGLLENNPQAAMCVGRTDIIDENGNFKNIVQGEYDGAGSLYTKLISGTAYVSSVSILVKTEVYRDVEFVDPYIEDLPAWLQISKSWNVVHTPLIVSSYRKTSGSMSSNTLKMVASEKRIIKKFLLLETKTFNHYPKGWCGRWFKALAMCEKRKALELLFSRECDSNILFGLDFYKGLVKLTFFRH